MGLKFGLHDYQLNNIDTFKKLAASVEMRIRESKTLLHAEKWHVSFVRSEIKGKRWSSSVQTPNYEPYFTTQKHRGQSSSKVVSYPNHDNPSRHCFVFQAIICHLRRSCQFAFQTSGPFKLNSFSPWRILHSKFFFHVTYWLAHNSPQFFNFR